MLSCVEHVLAMAPKASIFSLLKYLVQPEKINIQGFSGNIPLSRGVEGVNVVLTLFSAQGR
jgi:hypothetical protein